jgi:hypothetical protein
MLAISCQGIAEGFVLVSFAGVGGLVPDEVVALSDDKW